jgi:ribosomal protein S1
MGNTMKYKINDIVEFKAGSLSHGKIVDYEKDSYLYSIKLSSGSKIKCTEHYIKSIACIDE